jgi:hypothetical protein
MQEIVKIQTSRLGDLYAWHITGLNVFRANRVEVPWESDPRLLFMRGITSTPCAGYVGSLALNDLCDAPEEITGYLADGVAWLKLPMNLYLTEFCPHGKDDSYLAGGYVPGYYVPSITPTFWSLTTDLASSTSEYLMRCDALAVFAGANNERSARAIELLKSPSIDHDALVCKLADIFEFVVLTASDNFSFEVYSCESPLPALARSSLDAAAEAVRNSAWYIANQDALRWIDGDLDECLKLVPG